MKKNIIITLTAVLFVIGVTAYFVYMDKVDTIYAINYAKCFSNYDIAQVDRFLDESTLINYKGTEKAYSELRDNVINALQEKRFVMTEGGSYGYGDGFSKGTQVVGIENHVEVDGKTREDHIKMTLKHIGPIITVKSLSSDDEFFGYLFFGEHLVIEE